MSRGIGSSTFVAHVAGGAMGLLIATSLVVPASASAAVMATDSRLVVPRVGAIGAAPSGMAAAARIAAAARTKVNLSRKRRPLPPAPKPKQSYGPWRTALCSWYWEPQGLAGGGYLTPNAMIVAHKTMPFGTRIQFSYKGRTCIAVVKDRGPYVGGREFDLGPGTAKALGFDGVDRVSYRLVH